MNLNVFIASSLRLKDDRDAVAKAISRINEEQKGNGISYSVFDYVKNETIVQQLEHGDAQIPIRQFLNQSVIFVMIVRGRIGKLTVDEFSDAARSFYHGRFPQHIFIYYDEDHSGDAVEDDGTSISYPKFERDYLNKLKIDWISNDWITHKSAYYIPFGEEKGYHSLEQQVYENITNLLNAGRIPYPGSVLPWAIETSDFYTEDESADQNRREKCYKDIYYVRPVDEEMASSISEKQVLFIQGATLTGKTRAAMNLVSHLNDGWVTFFPSPSSSDRSQKVLKMMRDLLRYCDNHPNHPQHYLYIDDIYDLSFEADDPDEDVQAKQQEKIDRTLKQFRNLLTNPGSRIKLIATSTKDISETCISSLEDNEQTAVVTIRNMSDVEFQQAVRFFHNLNISNENKDTFKYHAIGAILLDLDSIRAVYTQFCNGKPYVEAIRKSLLRAIKATSIWKRRRMGDIALLKELTYFFASECPECEDMEKEKIDKQIGYAIKVLAQSKSGITKVSDDMLLIQEYVYEHILEHILKEDEKELVNDILNFSLQQKLPMLEQVAKLGSRTQNSKGIAYWLFKRFITEDKMLMKGWVPALLAEKDAVERTNDNSTDESHYYTDIFINAINATSELTTRLKIYHMSNEMVRTHHLLPSLMRLARTEEDWMQIRQLPDYHRYVEEEQNIRVLCALCQLKQLGFEQSLQFFRIVQAKFSYSLAMIADIRFRLMTDPMYHVEDVELLHCIWDIEHSIDQMMWKVSTPDEWETMKGIQRDFYYLKTSNTQLLERIAQGQCVDDIRAQLTDIEYLSWMPAIWFRYKVQVLFDPDDITAASDYLKEALLDKIAQALDSKILSEQQVIMVVSYAVGIFIKCYQNVHFDGRMKQLFGPAYNFIHPKTGRRLILINSYAYWSMLLYNGKMIDSTRASSLLSDLDQHMADADNPIQLIPEILGTMITAVDSDIKCAMHIKVNMLKRVKRIANLPYARKNTILYRKLINISRNRAEAMNYLAQMRSTGYQPDDTILVAICEHCDSLAEKLSFVKLPFDLPDSYGVKPVIPNLNEKWKQSLQNNSIYWRDILACQITNEVEREVLHRCFQWIQQEHPEWLEDSYYYNTIIENRSFIPKFADLWAFIEEAMSEHFPDIYTCEKLMHRMKLLKQDKATEMIRFNTLQKEMMLQKRWSANHLLFARVQVYGNYREQLPMLMWHNDENGELCFDDQAYSMNAIKFLSDLKIQIQAQPAEKKKTIYSVLRQIEGFDEHVEHIKEIIGYEKKETDFADTLDGLKAGLISIETAIGRLIWDRHPASAVLISNKILNFWAQLEQWPEDAIDRILKLYDEYFVRAPQSELYATMMKFARNLEDIKAVYKRLKEAQSAHPLITSDPSVLTVQFRMAHNYTELCQLLDAFESFGGKVELSHLASMIPYMLSFIEDNPDHPDTTSREILDKLCLYAFMPQTETNLPRHFEHLTRKNMRADILIRLIGYLKNNQFQLIECKDVLTAIRQCYLRLIFNDIISNHSQWYVRIKDVRLNYLVLKAILECRDLVIPEKFNPYFLNLAILGTHGLRDYTDFIVAFRNAGCTNVGDVTRPLLIQYRQNKQWKLNKDEMATARRLYSRIVVMSKLNNLHYRDYIPESVTLEPRHHDNDEVQVYPVVREVCRDENGNPMSLNELLYKAVQNLDDPYRLALQCLYMHEKPRLKVDKNTQAKDYYLILHFENEFALCIQNRTVPFEEVKQLVGLWIRSGWIPNVRIVAAIFCAYREWCRDSDNAIAEEAKTFFEGMKKNMTYFKDKDTETYSFYYQNMGVLTDQEKERKYHVLVSKKDFYKLTFVNKKNNI